MMCVFWGHGDMCDKGIPLQKKRCGPPAFTLNIMLNSVQCLFDWIL